MPPLITIPKEHRALFARLTPEAIARLRERTPVAAHVQNSHHDTSQVVCPATNATTTRSKRRHVDRSAQWPPVGTVLEGQFHGETFRAQVVAAPKLKAKRALKLLSAPVKGVIVSSFSKGQDVVTLAHRQKLGVKGKTGLQPAWSWWKPIAVSTP